MKRRTKILGGAYLLMGVILAEIWAQDVKAKTNKRPPRKEYQEAVLTWPIPVFQGTVAGIRGTIENEKAKAASTETD